MELENVVGKDLKKYIPNELSILAKHVESAQIYDTQKEDFSFLKDKVDYNCDCYTCQCDGGCDCVCQGNCCDAGPCYGK